MHAHDDVAGHGMGLVDSELPHTLRLRFDDSSIRDAITAMDDPQLATLVDNLPPELMPVISMVAFTDPRFSELYETVLRDAVQVSLGLASL